MALLFSRLRLLRNGPVMWKQTLPVATAVRAQSVATEVDQKPGESFEQKNERLHRPLSPHLTIYKLQMTSVLSLTHRATGLVLSGGLYGLSIGMLVLPSAFPHYMNLLQSMAIASPVLFTLKFSVAWTFIYHMLNGIRHLAWDLGYGFELKNLYISGYAVLGSSLALSLLAASL